MEKNKNLNEFLVPRFQTTELVGNFESIGNIYTNDALKKYFLGAIINSPTLKYFEELFHRLIFEEKILIPCFFNRNIFSFAFYKIYRPRHYKKRIAGFYSIDTKCVYIMIDNNLNIFSLPNRIELENVVVHELTHWFSFASKPKFMSVFKNDLILFYKNFFRNIFEIQDITTISDTDINKILIFLSKTFDSYSDVNTNQAFNKYKNIIRSIFIKNDNMEYEEKLKIMFVFLKIALSDLKVFFNIYYLPKYRFIIDSLNDAYFQSFGFENNTRAVWQEIIFPSEVACVLAEYNIRKTKLMLSKM